MTDRDAIKKRWLEGNMLHWQDITALVERVRDLETVLREAPSPQYAMHGGQAPTQYERWYAKKDKLLEGKEPE